MKIFDFSEKVGKHLSVFQSNFIMSKIVNHRGIYISVLCIYTRMESSVIMKQLYLNCFLLWTEQDMYVGQIKKDKGRGGTSCVLGEGRAS